MESNDADGSERNYQTETATQQYPINENQMSPQFCENNSCNAPVIAPPFAFSRETVTYKKVVFNNYNVGTVGRGYCGDVVLEISEPMIITKVTRYHYANGAQPGKLSILNASNGRPVGTWVSFANGYDHVSFPYIGLYPGAYIVQDTAKGSWSCNSGSGRVGFTQIESSVAKNHHRN